MFSELWNNKVNIFKNYISILKYYLPDIAILVFILGLIVIYAYLRSKEFNIKDKILLSTIETQPVGAEGFTTDVIQTKIEKKLVMPVTLFVTPDSQRNLLQIIGDTYLTRFNQPNIQARGFDTRNELQRTYNKCIIPITDEEKKASWDNISTFVDTLPNNKRLYVITWLSKIQIAKGASWLESGMPHTHGTYIIMRPDWFSLSGFKSSTLIHEMTHVIQRQQPDAWSKLYEQWGFIRADELSGLESQLELNRCNPDGMETHWVWNPSGDDKYYWISAVFNSVNPSALTDVSYLAYPISLVQSATNQSFKYTGTTPLKLSSFPVFQSYFNIHNNHYHPNEIGAQYAEYYFTASGDSKYITIPAYAEFAKWFNSII